ncbi:hexose kinase [Haloechinothrix sp. YIM 98757]|uniref:Hexose kinase n=1 Tax=Haloechinothrix aidingensis TaxID=2752311 RepID=A0A838AAC7_9PSEU|nr:hexose kinase [Haloechinothrix aidingensis]
MTAGAVLAVTLNTALDVTYHVDALVPHASHRVRCVRSRGGGKGVNVARVLHALGHEVRVLGTAGGVTGDALRADLRAAGLDEDLTRVAGQTRRSVTVVDTDATVFNEPGPEVTGPEWDRFVAGFDEHLRSAGAVVLAGSLPPGVADDAYARLAARAAAAGVATVLDTSGAALRLGCRGGPAVVAPNAAELAGATGVAGVDAGARVLLDAGAAGVAVSCGTDGIVVVTGEETWRAAPPAAVAGNPTGAGDAATAAFTAGLLLGRPWHAVLAEAVALSAAAVASPVAGEVEFDTYRDLVTGIRPVRGAGRSGRRLCGDDPDADR